MASRMVAGALIGWAGLLAGPASAGDSGPDTFSYTPAPSRSPAAGPVLALPKVDWSAAGAAAGIGPDDGLAGDPNSAPKFRLLPPPAEIDSYFNSVDWQKSQDAMASHRHQGAVAQLRGTGEAMALGAAQQGAVEAITGAIDGE